MTTIHEAEQMGKARGLAAASWVFDGNTDQAVYRDVLRMLDEGDSELHDVFGPPAWLSGEWAGESIPEIFGEIPEDEDVLSVYGDVMVAYENAADEAYLAEIERVARYMTTDDAS